MDEELGFRAKVDVVMLAIAAGRDGAVWELHALAEPDLGRIVRREAQRVNVWLTADEVFEVTLDAAMEIARIARSWEPAGALPWVWAKKRVRNLVHAHIDTFTRELDDELAEEEAPPPAAPPISGIEALRKLAEVHDQARELQARLERYVTPRDADIWLSYQVEQDGGNRSPAVTIAAEHEMRPDAVRKVVQRVGERVGPATTVEAESEAAA